MVTAQRVKNRPFKLYSLLVKKSSYLKKEQKADSKIPFLEKYCYKLICLPTQKELFLIKSSYYK